MFQTFKVLAKKCSLKDFIKIFPQIVFKNLTKAFNMDINCNQIIEAVNASVDPCTSQSNRLTAYNFLEKMKTDCHLMLKYGTELCKLPNSPSVRHFALQMLEEIIKYHWNSLSIDEKQYIKNLALWLIDIGTLPIMQENMHIKDQASRLVVEMMKREWPQQWQDLLKDLNTLSRKGTKQAELVLLVLLRISEDVATLKNFQKGRRQDIYKSLNHVMGDIFNLYFILLEDHYSKYKQNPDGSQAHQEHGRVTQMIFVTLTSYVEWVAPSHIFSQENFFSAICTLIVDTNLSLQVTECLLQIVLRKEKIQNMIPAQILFQKNILQPILSAAEIFCIKPVTEHNYMILKGLTQVLSNIGIQLASVWVKGGNISEPPDFELYLNALMAFTRHPSLVIYSYTKNAWRSLFRNEMVSKAAALLAIIPQWMQTIFTKVVKKGYPSHTKDESSLYSILDFDSDAEYQVFFSGVRVDTVETLKYAISLRPDVYFSLVKLAIEETVVRPVPTEPPANDEELEFGSALAIDWSALSSVTESAMHTIFQASNFIVPIDEGIKLLEAICTYRSSDPVIVLAVVEICFGLTCFLPDAPHMVEPVVNKMLEAIVFKVEYELNSSIHRFILNKLHRDSCQLLLKMVKNYHTLIMPHFESVSTSISQIITSEYSLVGNLELTMLEQARISLTKRLRDLAVLDVNISKSLAPVMQRWVDLRPSLSTPTALLDHLGVTNEDPKLYETFQSNRRFITLCFSLTLAVSKGVDPVKMIDDYSLDFIDGCRKILHKHIFPMLVTAYTYCRSYHGIWSSEMQPALIHHNEMFKLSTKEMDNLLGVSNTFQGSGHQIPTNMERIRSFIFSSHDTLCVILGTIGTYCGMYLYDMPNIVEYTILSPLYNLKSLPDNRVRHILRSFVGSFCMSCPAEQYNSVLLPVLSHLCPIMFEVLTMRWQTLAEMAARPDKDEEDKKEVVEEMLIRCTARDYIEFLRILLISSSRDQTTDTPVCDVNMDENMDTEEVNLSAAKLSSVGRLVLSVDSICHPVVSSLLMSLTCADSVCMRKSINVLLVCIEAMVKDYQHYLSDEAVSQFLMAVLKGIHMYGEHETDKAALLGIGTKLYALLRPKFEIVRTVLSSVGKIEAIEKLDKLILESEKNLTQKQIKARRDCFHWVIEDIIGKNIGEKFKKEVDIKNLLPMKFFKKPRQNPVRLDETSSDLNLCSLFDSGET